MRLTFRAAARAALLTCLALAPACLAAALPTLTPVTARYQITVNGISAGPGAVIRVAQLDGARHEVSFNVQNRFFSHHESSRFDWRDCELRSQDYRVEFHGFGLDREFSLLFDWPRNVAVETTRKGKREIPLAGHLLDGLNMSQYARCQLFRGKRELHLGIVDKHETRDLLYTVTGNERISTGLGTLDTVVLENRHAPSRFRRTRLWVAPSLDWFMVRFEHVENPAVRGSLLLTELRVDRPAARP